MGSFKEIVVGILILVMGLGMLGFAFKSATASGKADFCYIRRLEEGQIILEAHIPWRADHRIGYFLNIEKALEVAKAINCRLATE